jgi:dTDP-4-dehydrorhamnose reductase
MIDMLKIGKRKNSYWEYISMNVYVAGHRGMLGRDVVKVFKELGHAVSISYPSDISNIVSIEYDVRTIKPDVIINCAAYTDVDGCEDDTYKATLVNSIGVLNLAIVAKMLNLKLVHFSSDQVFGGFRHHPIFSHGVEVDDSKIPVNVYGKTKLAGELLAEANIPGLLYVIRTSWLYGSGRENFVDRIYNGLQSGNPLVIDDECVSKPTWTRDLALATVRILESCDPGVYHIATGLCTTKRYVAELVAKKFFGIGSDEMDSRVVGVPASEAGYGDAERPLVSSLKESVIPGYNVSSWLDSIEKYFLEKEYI